MTLVMPFLFTLRKFRASARNKKPHDRRVRFKLMKRRYWDAPDLSHVGKNGYRFINAVSDFATHASPIPQDKELPRKPVSAHRGGQSHHRQGKQDGAWRKRKEGAYVSGYWRPRKECPMPNGWNSGRGGRLRRFRSMRYQPLSITASDNTFCLQPLKPQWFQGGFFVSSLWHIPF